jgi:hypothetical protein
LYEPIRPIYLGDVLEQQAPAALILEGHELVGVVAFLRRRGFEVFCESWHGGPKSSNYRIKFN